MNIELIRPKKPASKLSELIKLGLRNNIKGEMKMAIFLYKA